MSGYFLEWLGWAWGWFNLGYPPGDFTSEACIDEWAETNLPAECMTEWLYFVVPTGYFGLSDERIAELAAAQAEYDRNPQESIKRAIQEIGERTQQR